MINICVTGFQGRLGSELIRMGCEPLDCDITKHEEIELAILHKKPDVIINCAAYTNVDGCEDNELYKHALSVNTWGVGHIRDVFDGKLIHISSDYIFNGREGPYSETFTKFDPVNGYGFSKVGAEALLSTHEKPSMIVRTTGLYGGCSGQHDFAKLILSHLKEGKELQVTNSLRGNQTYVPHLAEALIYCAKTDGLPRLLHVASKEVITRYEFAVMIANMFEYDKKLLVPVNNRSVPGWVAPRPIKGGLKVNLAEKKNVPIYKIIDGLKDYKDRMC
jgi:dTDP-4-dehydrorhamnose reductase